MISIFKLFPYKSSDYSNIIVMAYLMIIQMFMFKFKNGTFELISLKFTETG